MTMHKLARALMCVCKEPHKIFYLYTHQILLLYYSCNQRKGNAKVDFHQTILLLMLDKVLRKRLQSQKITEQYTILYMSCLITASMKIASMMEHPHFLNFSQKIILGSSPLHLSLLVFFHKILFLGIGTCDNTLFVALTCLTTRFRP